MTGDPARPPRFPYAAALLCAGCLGAAGWVWVEYSYAWDVTSDDVADDRAAGWMHRYLAVRGDEVVDGHYLVYEPLTARRRTRQLARLDPAARRKLLLKGKLAVAELKRQEREAKEKKALAESRRLQGEVAEPWQVKGDGSRPPRKVKRVEHPVLVHEGPLPGWHLYLARRVRPSEYERDGCVRGRLSEDPYGIVILDNAASRFTGASIAGLVVGAMGVFVFTLALRHWLGERRKSREEARA